MNYKAAKLAFERAYWTLMLDKHGSVHAAAKAAGQNRTHVHKLLSRIGLRSPFRQRKGRF